MIIRIKQIFILALIFHVISLSSCKKEYTDIYETRYTNTVEVLADNYLKAFAVVDTLHTDTIKASLTEEDIIIYWPIWKEKPEKVAPIIHLPAKASIRPAIGDSILLQNDINYTVTSESGATKTYKLKVIDLQQPPIFRPNISSFKLGSSISLNGEYFVAGFSTRVFLEEIGGDREFELPKPTVNVNAMNITTTIPHTIDTALYRIRLEHGKRSVYSALDYDTVQVGYSPLNISGIPQAITVKRGETFTISGTDIRFIKSVRIASLLVLPSTYQSVIIENTTEKSITVKIPADALLGNYDYVEIKSVVIPQQGKLEYPLNKNLTIVE